MSTVQTTADNLLHFAAIKSFLLFTQTHRGDFRIEPEKLRLSTSVSIVMKL